VLTGQLPLAWGFRANGGVIPPHVPTLPTILQEHGYRSALFGKAHFTGPEDECRRLGIPRWRYPYGFDDILFAEEGRRWRDGDDYEAYLKRVGWHGWQRAHGIGNNDARTAASPLPRDHYQTAWATEESIRWLREQGRRQPFLLMTSYVKPHAPYDPPAPYDTMYDPRSVPAPIGSADDLTGLAAVYSQDRMAYGWDTIPKEAHLRARAYYYGNITFIDDEVGRLLTTLEQLGLADNTIVVYVSDHGDLLGDHGLYFKGVFLRESWHVALIIKAPAGLARQGAVDRFASLQDLMPTLLSLCGLPVPEGLHGQDLARDLDNGPDVAFGSYETHPLAMHAARTHQWQYIFHEAGGYEELYDIRSDRDECRNLASQPQALHVVAELRRRTAVWLAGLGDVGSLDANGDLRAEPASPLQAPPLTCVPLGLRPY